MSTGQGEYPWGTFLDDQHLFTYNEPSPIIGENNPRKKRRSDDHEETDEEFCQICGDIASGWHCG